MQARQDQLNKVSERLEQTAIIQERMLGRLDALERWRDDQDRRMERQEERRDERIERQPDTVRNLFGTYGGCIGQIFYACVGFLSLATAVTALIVTLTR